MQVVDDAWKAREKVGTQVKIDGGVTVQYWATVKTRLWSGVIEMWLDQDTRTLASAYPLDRR